MTSINLPISGMSDVFGFQLKKRNYVIRLLSDFAQRFGFQQLEVPIIEKATSFAEEVVGKSPWPEWNKRGCFYLSVDNYIDSYKNCISTENALLNPEGTISVTRWLGKVIKEIGVNSFPLKLFYDVQCFRNELINNLSETKHRQFRQFGIEILGSSAIIADMEIVCMINEFLLLLGFNRESIIVRISDVRIFKQLILESKIDYDNSLVIKELLDSIAESRAGKDPNAVYSLKTQFWCIMSKYCLNSNCVKKWELILNVPYKQLSKETKLLFGNKYSDAFNDLTQITESLIANGIKTKVDLCVVRSHEYYTGLSFEIDVISKNVSFYEIAGGGRYDKLVSSFLTETDKDMMVPSTGFAFGIERLIEAISCFGLFSDLKYVESYTHFDNASADMLLILPKVDNACMIYPNAMSEVKNSSLDKRYNIYVGDDKSQRYINTYMDVSGIANKKELISRLKKRLYKQFLLII